MVQITKLGARVETNGVRESARDYVGVGREHSMAFKIQDVHDFAVEGALANNQDRRPNGLSQLLLAGFDIDRCFQVPLPVFVQTQTLLGTGWGSTESSSLGQGPRERRSTSLLSLQPPQVIGINSQSMKPALEYRAATTRTSTPPRSINLTPIFDSAKPMLNDLRKRWAKALRRIHKMCPPGMRKTSELPHVPDSFGILIKYVPRYSGVRRDITDYPPLQSTQPNRYQPPARRPPSGKPTVAGAPVDPAIISSQIARPDSSTQTERDPPSEAASGSSSGKVSDPVSTSPKKQDTPKEDNMPKQATVQETPTSSLAKAPPSNATGSVEVDALKAFKQFSEKQKIRVADDRRARVMQDKNVKLNDLRGFSKNFKLNTPVPSDLVPILAKDKKKQDEIMEKAQRNAAEQAATPSKPQAKLGEPNGAKAVADLKHDSSKVAPGSADRLEYPRQTGPPRGPQANNPSLRSRQMQQQYPMPMPAPNEQGLSHRLTMTQRDRQAGIPVNIPTPLPIHSGKPPSRPGTNAPRLNGSQGSGTLRTPTSATSGKFNVKAHEFVPNPAASSFKPNGQPSAASSPNANVKSKPSPRATSPSAFFGDKKPVPACERPSIMDHFKPLKRLVEKAEKDGKAKDYATNGGIAFAYTTPVTWSNFTDEGEGKSYKDIFGGLPGSDGASPRLSTASPINPDMPHQHQVPAHLQPRSHGTPVMQTPPQALYQVPPQQHLYPAAPQHFDEQRLHASPSLSTYSTPRMQSGYGGYPSPVAQHPMVGPAPANFQYPPTLGPGHPQMMNHGGQQAPPFRQFSGTPHFMPAPGQQLAAPLMVQQGSQGQYLPQGGPFPGHLPVYATGAVPQYGSSQPANGYPSPGRGAPMMMHQGSYPGQNAQMHAAGPQYGQPFYSPQPPHPNSKCRTQLFLCTD